MARPVTLFTGQWADLTLEELARKCGEWGFDGLELACWGDHFDVDRALSESGYIEGRWEILRSNGLNCWAISTHLVGQAVCDPIDARHGATLPPDVWGDGDPEGVRRRAARKVKDTARAAARFGVTQVNGFTGSSIWHLLYSFPPNDFAEIERGYEDFAERWNPIIDVFDEEGVRWGLEVHPTEIAYDFVTTRKALDAIGNREGFGINFDPSHFAHQFLDSAAFIEEFAEQDLPLPHKGQPQALERTQEHTGGPPGLRQPRARLGLRLPRPRRREPRRLHQGAEPYRLRGSLSASSGRTRGWTASTGPGTRWPSPGARTSSRRRRPSTRPSRGRSRDGAGRDRGRARRLQVHGPRPLQRLPPGRPLLRRRPCSQDGRNLRPRRGRREGGRGHPGLGLLRDGLPQAHRAR